MLVTRASILYVVFDKGACLVCHFVTCVFWLSCSCCSLFVAARRPTEDSAVVACSGDSFMLFLRYLQVTMSIHGNSGIMYRPRANIVSALYLIPKSI